MYHEWDADEERAAALYSESLSYGEHHRAACREYAHNVGRENEAAAWVLTDYDTWVRNPHYTGTDLTHPEDY